MHFFLWHLRKITCSWGLDAGWEQYYTNHKSSTIGEKRRIQLRRQLEVSMHATSDMFVSIQAIDWIDRYNTLRVNEEVLNRSLSRILFTALPSCHCCIYRLHRHPIYAYVYGRLISTIWAMSYFAKLFGSKIYVGIWRAIHWNFIIQLSIRYIWTVLLIE